MPNLILVPTDLERGPIEANLRFDRGHWQFQTIGFGVVSAAVQATRAIACHHPHRVVVAGIAGLYDAPQNNSLAVGEAVWFGRVALDGIGVGQGDEFIAAEALGWGSERGDHEDGSFDLSVPTGQDAERLLVTACSASASVDEAASRMRRFYDASGEDMESFAVAAACRAAAVTCSVVRGFSNTVGCRDHSRWRVETALSNVTKHLQAFVDENYE